MTLIKYYKTNTCYDGEKEFPLRKKSSPRYYPDEYLIANILEKYHRKRFPDSKNIIVLTEPWLNDEKQPTRDGGKNTFEINKLIIERIGLAEKEKDKNILILVPFLYGYHHPGITIDVKNKTAIYLDPYGVEAHYSEVNNLQALLEGKGFTLLTVTTKQQTDSVSCGPILTASMVKFIEEFMATGGLSVNGFKASRPNLATERLFQMYVNNTDLEEIKSLIDEIMLADEELWRTVFWEQELSDEISQRILSATKVQKAFIQSLPENWEEDASLKSAVSFIKNFQSQITKYIFLQDRDIASKIDTLVDASDRLCKQTDLRFDELNDGYLTKNEDQIAKMHRMMGFMNYPHNITQSNIQNFEDDKNNIQKDFEKSLNTLKNKLDSLNKNDVVLKKAGDTLFEALSTAQENFFEGLQTTSPEEVTTKIANFRKTCAENVKIADKIMGHGWLYRTVEILIKAVIGLFAGIGMVLGSILCQGLAKSEHRKQFAKTFFTLNQTQGSQALNVFKQQVLGDSKENQGLLSLQNFKK